MTVDMADNGEADKAAKPATDAGARAPGADGPQTEWTASDTRGPLNAADPESGITEPAAEPAHAMPPSDAAGSSEEAASPAITSPSTAEPAATAAEPRSRHVPVVPIIIGLISGAIIGAGSAALMYGYSGTGDTEQVTALASRLDALEKRPDPQPEIGALKSQLAAVPKTPAFDPAPLQDKIAGLQSDVAALKQKKPADPALSQKVSAIGGSVDALKAQSGDVKGLDGKVAAISSSIDALKAQGADVKSLDGKVAALSTAIDGLKKQDDAQQGGIAALQTGQKSLEGKVATPALAVVADSLVEAITLGKPYASQADAAASLGADPAKVAVLRENAGAGVPSAQALAEKFAPLADPITATAYKAPPNAGLMDKLKSGMMSMVSVRSADATSGDDVGSRVSRIEADLAHGDVAGAYSTWNGLPADAKSKAEAWGALAKTHVEAMAAARALQQQAIAALGGKKS